MKFLNYNNRFLLKKDNNFPVGQIMSKPEKKPFNLQNIIATNTLKDNIDNPLTHMVPDYTEDIEECQNAHQINISNTNTNNLSLFNKNIYLQESSSKRAFTEPSVETSCGAFSSNHSNQSNKINLKEFSSKMMFPFVEGENHHNEDSFDFSVNEEYNIKIKKYKQW